MQTLILKYKNQLFFFLLILFSFPMLVTTIADPDIWWHIMQGQDLFAKQAVDYSNYYWSEVTTNHADQQYTWLGEIIFYLTYYFSGTFGLIMLRCTCMIICIWCLWQMSDKKPTLFKLLIFTFLILATQQKHLIRNSLFALALFPLILYLFTEKLYIILIPIMMFWGACHGSYLLGFCTLVLLSIAEIIDGKFVTKKLSFTEIFLITITIVAITYYFYSTSSLFRSYISVPSVIKMVTEVPNQTIFAPDQNNIAFVSKDFLNPLKDSMHEYHLFIRFTFILMILTIAMVKLKRFIYIIPTIPIWYVCIGYRRTLGYIAIYCCYLLFTAEKNNHLRFKLHPYLSGSILASVIGAILFGGITIHYIDTSIGIGKSYFYSKDVIQHLVQYNKPFTSLSSGGYVLFHYNKAKKVYIDTHFGAHSKEVFDHYHGVMLHKLHPPRECDSAIFTLKDISLIQYFAKYPEWQLEAIDQGMILFSKIKGNKSKPPIIYTNNMEKEDFLNSLKVEHRNLFLNALRICGVNIK